MRAELHAGTDSVKGSLCRRQQPPASMASHEVSHSCLCIPSLLFSMANLIPALNALQILGLLPEYNVSHHDARRPRLSFSYSVKRHIW